MINYTNLYEAVKGKFECLLERAGIPLPTSNPDIGIERDALTIHLRGKRVNMDELWGNIQTFCRENKLTAAYNPTTDTLSISRRR